MTSRLALGFAGVAIASAASISPAAATPWMPHAPDNNPRSQWIDCGPAICTKYFSKEATKALADYSSQGFVDFAQALPEPIVHLFFGNELEDTQEIEENAKVAATYGGCLQSAWPVGDSSNEFVYSWTTHPHYCGSENARYDYVGSPSGNVG